MTQQEIIDELNVMNTNEIGLWDLRSEDGVVDEAGNGTGALRFTVQDTADAFDAEDSASQIVIIGGVSTHIISQNQGGDPKK